MNRHRIVGVFGAVSKTMCETLVGIRLRTAKGFDLDKCAYSYVKLPVTASARREIKEVIRDYQSNHGTVSQDGPPGVLLFHLDLLVGKFYRSIVELLSEVWVVEGDGYLRKVKDRYGVDDNKERKVVIPSGPAISSTGPAVPVSRASSMRRFVLERTDDVSGVSGTGTVMEGVVFSNGQVAYSWLSPLHTVTTCQSLDVVEKLHGHDGRAKVRFIDGGKA